MAEKEEKKDVIAADAVIDALPHSVVVLNLDGEIISVNPAHLKIFGHKSVDEVLEKGFKGFKETFCDPEKDIPRSLELFKEVIEKGFIEEPLEFRFRRVDGKEFVCTISASLIRDAEGNPKNIVTTIKDITELKRAEEERAMAAAMATATMEAMPIGVIVHDLEGKVLQTNEASEKMFGYKREEGIGKSVIDFIAEEDTPRALESMLKGLREGFTRGFECIGVRKDGSKIQILIDSTLIRDPEDNPSSVVISLRDITETKKLISEIEEARNKLEERVEERTAKFREAKAFSEGVFSSMIDTLIVVDPDGKIRTINRATEELLGYKEDELIGQPVAVIFEEEEEEEESIFRSTGLMKLMKKGSISGYETTYKTKSGNLIPVLLSGSTMRDKKGKLIASVVVGKNITERKQAEEELKSSYVELRDSRDELIRSEKLAFTGRIAAGIAHEIRNPLTTVSMSAQQLKKVLKSEKEGAEYIEMIIRNTERINYLITELLNCARPPKLQIQSYNIHRVLENVLESTNTKIRSQNIEVVKRFTSKPSRINIDKEQMERAFSNIVINAIEAMPKGGKLTIDTELYEKSFVVKIQDIGKGISEEDIIRIFDPFFTSKSGGVGLGLTLCYGIIVSHGGTMEVESEPKRGAIFTVSLPIK